MSRVPSFTSHALDLWDVHFDADWPGAFAAATGKAPEATAWTTPETIEVAPLYGPDATADPTAYSTSTTCYRGVGASKCAGSATCRCGRFST